MVPSALGLFSALMSPPRDSTVTLCWPMSAPSPVLNVVRVNDPSDSSCPVATCPVSPPLPAMGVKMTEPLVTGFPLYVTLPVTLARVGMSLSVPPQPPSISIGTSAHIHGLTTRTCMADSLSGGRIMIMARGRARFVIHRAALRRLLERSTGESIRRSVQDLLEVADEVRV